MFYLSDSMIDNLVKEDVPYLDLTTLLLGIGDRPGKIAFATREPTLICGTEEVQKILEKSGAEVLQFTPSGSFLPPGTTFLEAQGTAAGIHTAWKVSQNLLEYASGIATRTKLLVDRARQVHPPIQILTTRKHFPGTKELSIKAIVMGGAWPHRLGLSETILFFRQHLAFIGGIDQLGQRLAQLKARAPEKRIVVEAETYEEAVSLAKSGVEIIQLDKFKIEETSLIVKAIRKINPEIKIAAAGGVNVDNVAAVAATGVDMIVLSSVYFGKPADIRVDILPTGGF
ncbi:MAG: ModD protein [Desulfobacca sp.]|nr:ModD protein [Desulfobacca sp.]